MMVPPELRRDFFTYATGYVLAVLLTLAAFGIVYFHLWTRDYAFGAVLVLALIQMLVHMRCFLHIRLARSSRDDLQLILFSTVIIFLMVSGTFIILFNLDTRMM